MEFRDRMLSGEILAGTFVKSPVVDVVEVLTKSDLDFICLDAEHSPWGRESLNACLAVTRAIGFPTLVRVTAGTPELILQALDAGALGVVVPHVDNVEKAQAVAKSARFGNGGRGYAGSTRWAGFATRPMAEVLAQSKRETVVIAQIEEPEGVEVAAEIAAVDGIDGLFVGPADLSVAYGKTDTNSEELRAALSRVGQAAKTNAKAFMTFVPNAAKAAEWREFGLTMFFVASEHAMMLSAANSEAEGIHALKSD